MHGATAGRTAAAVSVRRGRSSFCFSSSRALSPPSRFTVRSAQKKSPPPFSSLLHLSFFKERAPKSFLKSLLEWANGQGLSRCHVEGREQMRTNKAAFSRQLPKRILLAFRDILKITSLGGLLFRHSSSVTNWETRADLPSGDTVKLADGAAPERVGLLPPPSLGEGCLISKPPPGNEFFFLPTNSLLPLPSARDGSRQSS